MTWASKNVSGRFGVLNVQGSLFRLSLSFIIVIRHWNIFSKSKLVKHISWCCLFLEIGVINFLSCLFSNQYSTSASTLFAHLILTIFISAFLSPVFSIVIVSIFPTLPEEQAVNRMENIIKKQKLLIVINRKTKVCQFI